MTRENMKIQAKKLYMTQIWQENKVFSVTVLKFESKDSFGLVKEGNKVNVSGINKGKGFQGVVKRHGFSGGPKSHGQKHNLRTTGSIGATDPQRTIPGRKMPGHMGNNMVTVKNLKVVKVDSDTNTVMLKGAVPGMKGNSLKIEVGEANNTQKEEKEE